MRDFDYVAPDTLRQAVSILAEHRGAARCLAGGTDLIEQIRTGRKTPSLVVDVKGIPELNRLSFSRRAGLRIGAAVPCAAIYENPDVRELYPILVDATSLIGDVKVQNRAGIGGNLCNAAPSADTAPALLALEAVCVAAGPKGTRQVPLERFFAGPGRTTLGPDELLVEVRVPPPSPNSAGCYQRLIPRNEMDIAVVGVGIHLTLVREGSFVVREARVALGAVAPRPVRSRRAEAYLRARALTSQTIEAAGERAALSAKPITDMRGSREYRLEMVKALTRKALRACGGALGAHLGETP